MTRRQHPGFTLVELLVTVAIIALLVALVVVALRSVRLSATRASSISALRQMVAGYSTYSTDHNHRLLPGYINEADFADGEAFGDLKVTLPNDDELDFNSQVDRRDAESYVWRLAPYVDGTWNIMFDEYSSRSLDTRIEEEIAGGSPGLDGDEVYGTGSAGYPGSTDLIGASHAPAYGLNSIMLGGDSVHGPPDIVDNHPWAASPADPNFEIAATRTSKVKNPAKMIVFGATAQMNQDFTPPQVISDEITFGYGELRAPFLATSQDASEHQPGDSWTRPQWAVETRSGGGSAQKTYIVLDSGAATGGGIGVPISRWGGTPGRTLDLDGEYVAEGIEKVPVGQLDGSVSTYDAARLAVDMSLWHWNYTSVISSNQ